MKPTHLQIQANHDFIHGACTLVYEPATVYSKNRLASQTALALGMILLNDLNFSIN